jgi:uncharacterized protein (DUF433 family)
MVRATDMKYIMRDDAVYGGKPCIKGHRIAVHDIAVWHNQGESPEQIARDFQLTLAQVHAALAYYYDHQAEIDAEVAAENAETIARARADVSPGAQRLREAIAQRRGSGTGG